jgi:ABC-2 type transport system ATP-binding protein
VDDVVVITHGRLAAQGPVADLAAATSTTRIRTPDTARLLDALVGDGIDTRLVAPDTVETRAADPDRVARIAAAAGVVVLELSRHTDNLEELFFDLVSKRAGESALEVSPL